MSSRTIPAPPPSASRMPLARPSQVLRGREMSKMTTSELAELLADNIVVALLPVGSTEPHGPHLGLGTDALLSEELAHRSATTLELSGRLTVIAPTIPFGVTEFAQGFAGAIGVKPQTLIALVSDVIDSLLKDGFTHVAVVNNHLEPAHVAALESAVAKARVLANAGSVSFPNQLSRRWGRTLTPEFKRGNCHAGCYETSLMMASAGGGSLIRPAIASHLPAIGTSLSDAIAASSADVTFQGIGMDQAYTGAPASASLREGETTYEQLVTMVVTEVEDALRVHLSSCPVDDSERTLRDSKRPKI